MSSGDNAFQQDLSAINLVGISKSFGTVKANQNIDLKVAKGTIHGIVGENGAGKSTLMSILYGFYQADAGEIYIDNKLTKINDSKDAIKAGIGMVHQHFMLVDTFTVLENIILGAENAKLLSASLAKARKLVDKLASEYGLEVDPDAVVDSIPVGDQQRVEILKALYRDVQILILDEPTGVLTPKEADDLFRFLRELRSQGKTIIFITHKLREIMALTDTVSVMRQGEMSEVLPTKNMTVTSLAEKMVGRTIVNTIAKKPFKPKEIALEVRDLCLVEEGVKKLNNVSFTLRHGEILGVAGVAGNGQTELLQILAGMKSATSGEIIVAGQAMPITGENRVDELRKMGVAHIPEDRHGHGLVLPFMGWENSVYGYHRKGQYSNGVLSSTKAIMEKAISCFKQFDVRPNDILLKTANFSGGNQQKIILAREIMDNPDVLLIGQPTRGVDIGAIEFIHKRIIEHRDSSKAALLVSVELEEILRLSDRIIVMFAGSIAGERNASDTNEHDLGHLMAGISKEEDLTSKRPVA